MEALRKYRGSVAVALAALMSLLGAALLLGANTGPPDNATLVLPPVASPALSPQAPFRVYLTGAVRQPGVYSVAAGSRLQESTQRGRRRGRGRRPRIRESGRPAAG